MGDGPDKLRDVFDQFRDYDRQRTAALLKKQRRRDMAVQPGETSSDEPAGDPNVASSMQARDGAKDAGE